MIVLNVFAHFMTEFNSQVDFMFEHQRKKNVKLRHKSEKKNESKPHQGPFLIGLNMIRSKNREVITICHHN